MTVKIIDPHLHFFELVQGDYHWLKAENPPFWPDKAIIQRDFSIDDLTNSLALTANFSLSGFIHIEAGFDNTKPWRELDYIDNLKPLPRRTVASIDLLAPSASFNSTLDKLQQYQSIIGVRHILDEQAFSILSSATAQQNFSRLNEITDFIFEVQLPLADNSAINVMPLLIKTIAQHSQLNFIINHAGFPTKIAPTNINSDTWHLWQKHISELAQYPNVFIKCSGWEMIDRAYEMSWFSTVTRFCIDSFSSERVMLASNFPLCLLSLKSYGEYWQDIIESSLIKQCSKNEKNALLYSNALNIYKL